MNLIPILEAIRNSFIGAEQVYMNGSCIGLFKILLSICPNALPYWSAENKHMVTKVEDKYYDITGEVSIDATYKLDDETYTSYYVAVAFPEKKGQIRRFANKIKLY